MVPYVRFQAYEQFYIPVDFNWTFRRTYPAADRLFCRPSRSPELVAKIKILNYHGNQSQSTSSMTKASAVGKAKSTPKATSAANKRAVSKPAAKPMPPMDHSKMKMPGMEMPPVKKD